MSTAPTPATCPACGATIQASQPRCWLCHELLPIQAEAVDSAPVLAALAHPEREGHALQFSLQSLLLVITLSAVCLGALVAVPPLGVLMLVVAAPALVRTCLTGASAKAAGQRQTLTDKLMAFLASAAIASAALVAAGIAFFTACTISVISGSAAGEAVGGNASARDSIWQIMLVGGIAFCGIASVAAFIGMFWITWPAKRPSR